VSGGKQREDGSALATPRYYAYLEPLHLDKFAQRLVGVLHDLFGTKRLDDERHIHKLVLQREMMDDGVCNNVRKSPPPQPVAALPASLESRTLRTDSFLHSVQ
jgi:hypothetical protein